MPARKRLRPPKKNPFSSERIAWNYMQGTSRRSAAVRRRLNKKHEQYFPKAMGAESMREVMRAVMRFAGNGKKFEPNTNGQYLASVDPDALRFIARWGREFVPYVWRKPPPFGEPMRKGCFRNAYTLMQRHVRMRKRYRVVMHRVAKLHYAEGIVVGPAVLMMLHGWNVQHGKRKSIAIDWTFYSGTKWIKYWGLDFSPDEYAELARVRGPRRKFAQSLFYKTRFNIRIKVKIMDILARRKRAGKKLPKRR